MLHSFTLRAPTRRRPAMRRSWLAIALAVGAAASGAAQDEVPAMGNRGLSLVASTPEARFYSDFWLSFHDYLYGRAREPEAVQPDDAAACLEALPADVSDPWRTAEAHYETEMAERHHRRDPLVRAIRHRFAGIATEHAPIADSTLALLGASAPAYRACLWDLHDARNRERIGELLRVVVAHGPTLRHYLEQVYRADWPAGIVVDVTPYAAFANTTSGRGEEPHVMLSNTSPDLVGWSGLEILFHEGSHTMFGPRDGTVARVFGEASEVAGVEPPWDLWHAVSFRTSGRIVEEMAAAEGDDYTAYYLRRGIFSEVAPILEEHWTPYLYREATMEAAALAVLRALDTEPDR